MTGSTHPSPFSHSHFGGADPIAALRDDFIQERNKKKKSPSDSSKPSVFRTAQRGSRTQICCGRPRDTEEVIPVTLLHRVFGQFQDDCHTGIMTEDDNEFVGKLANIMSDLHDDEAQRVKAVDEVFRAVHIKLNLSTDVPGTRYKMDSGLSVGNDDSDFPPFFIAEFKNEIGSSNSEPYMQAVSYYLEATTRYARKWSKLPCLVFFC